MTIYLVTLEDGETFLMQADLSRAEAPLRACWHPYGEEQDDWDWQNTPYQTADACHGDVSAAELIAQYFSESEDDCETVESVKERED